MSTPHAPARRPARGLSIVEMACCAAIVATLLGGALPALSDLGHRTRLRAAAAELQADVHLARTISMQRSQPVRLSWQPLAGGGTCYLVHTGDAGQCNCGATGAATCRSGAQAMRTVVLPGREAIGFAAASRSLVFDPRRGTVTPTATFKLDDKQGHAVHLVVNIMGRARTCSPGGQMAGLKAC